MPPLETQALCMCGPLLCSFMLTYIQFHLRIPTHLKTVFWTSATARLIFLRNVDKPLVDVAHTWYLNEIIGLYMFRDKWGNYLALPQVLQERKDNMKCCLTCFELTPPTTFTNTFIGWRAYCSDLVIILHELTGLKRSYANNNILLQSGHAAKLRKLDER